MSWDSRTGRYSQALVQWAISECCEEQGTPPLLQTEWTNETLGIWYRRISLKKQDPPVSVVLCIFCKLQCTSSLKTAKFGNTQLQITKYSKSNLTQSWEEKLWVVLALAKGLFYLSPIQRAGIQQTLSAVLSEFVKKTQNQIPKDSWLVSLDMRKTKKREVFEYATASFWRKGKACGLCPMK